MTATDSSLLLVDPDDQPAGSVEARINVRIRRAQDAGLLPPQVSEADMGAARRKPLVLSDYQRQTLVVLLDRFGDDMLRLMKEREESGFLTDTRAVWMTEQTSAWYEIADALRSKRGVK